MRKGEVSELLNEFFGTEINWQKLSKDELMQIYNIINEPDKLLDRLYNVLGSEKFIEVSIDFAKKKALEARPFRKFIKAMLGLK